ncbi:MAG: formate dehydrogenase accessory sulfurtransferase FdhD [Bacteroidia bacterium]|nr:formate dehydrogenase accessory sulfurtransferase FdhD [Bacteroidia bacterium]
MKPSVAVCRISKIQSQDEQFQSQFVDDLCAVEEPLEIRLGIGPENDRSQVSVAVTMRTPGHDFELALGFLFTEGVINNMAEILSIKYCVTDDTNNQFNIVRIELKPNVKVQLKNLERNFYTTSSCGICGKASIDAIHINPEIMCTNLLQKVKASTIISLQHTLRKQQNIFEYTGGLHACALFTIAGNILLLREDIGRHNALDKLIGAAMGGNTMPLNNTVLMLSGRASFELLQKAAMAGIKIVCAVGAPSNLAIQTADKFNITLIGFLRDNRFNIYTHTTNVIA